MEKDERMQFNGVFSKEDALASVDGDRDLLREVVGMFAKECEDSVSAIRKALDEKNASALDRSAHTLKGMVGNFGAKSSVEIALKLEMMGKRSDLAGSEETFAALLNELERLKVGLEQFASENA